jgi:hypothetical protein
MLNPRGVRGSAISKKGVNGRQPDISGGDEIMSIGLQMLEECQYLRGAEVIQIQLADRSLPSVGYETEEEHEGVSIAEDGMRTAASNVG